MAQNQADGFQTLGETYDSVSTGEFRSSGFIGQATGVRRWDCGWNADEREDMEGKKVPVGRVYRAGTKEEAIEWTKANMGLDFCSPVLLVTMPLASITNLDDDTKGKFKNPLVQASARAVGLGKDYKQSKHGPGLNLVTVPSMVDAYARLKGWYTDARFDVGVIGLIDSVADCSELIEKLVEMRKAIWAVLGEENWTVNDPEKVDSPKLKEALKNTLNTGWQMWTRLSVVHDPSHGAIYPKKDGTGTDRNRVPAITEYFPNERAAIAAGEKELAERAVVSKIPEENGHKVVAYAKLSTMATISYPSEKDWNSVVDLIANELLQLDGKPPKVKEIGVKKVIDEYGISVDDLKLFA